MDNGPWYAHKEEDGEIVLYSDDFTIDAQLKISGDFYDEHHKLRYANWLADKLNQDKSDLIKDEQIKVLRKIQTKMDNWSMLANTFFWSFTIAAIVLGLISWLT